MFFKKLQRHLTFELWRTFGVGAFFMLTLILIGRGLQLSKMLVGLGLGVLDTLLLFSYMAPMFMLVVIPLACMISVFLTFLRMSTDRELVALKAGGVSLYQLLGAPLAFALVCTILTFSVSVFGVAWGMGKFRSTVLEIAQTRAKVTIQPGVFNQDIFGLTLFARQVDPATGKLHQVIFEDSMQKVETQKDDAQKDEPKKSVPRITILAPDGEIRTDSSRGELVFHLENGNIYRLDKGNLSVLGFEDYNIRLNLSELLSTAGSELGDVRPKEMPWRDLLRIKNAEPGHQFYRKALNEIQKRLSLPMACLVLAIFAVPLACGFEGARQQVGLLVALLTFLAYYGLFSMGINLSEGGRLTPVVGAWAPNIIFLVLGLLGLYFTARERLPDLGRFLSKGIARDTLRRVFRAFYH